jgi:nucleoside 2-deoxyribosyltransferase
VLFLVLMKIFVAASYSSQVNYETGEVFPEYRAWLEDNLERLEKLGHTVFCALRSDQYKINDADPAEAFSLDEAEITAAEAMLAFVTDKVSAGVQTEIGMVIAQKKPVVLAHTEDTELTYFNRAIVLAGQASELIMPIVSDPFVSS